MIPVKYSLIAAAIAAFIGLESYTVYSAYQRGYKAADTKHELARLKREEEKLEAIAQTASDIYNRDCFTQDAVTILNNEIKRK